MNRDWCLSLYGRQAVNSWQRTDCIMSMMHSGVGQMILSNAFCKGPKRACYNMCVGFLSTLNASEINIPNIVYSRHLVDTDHNLYETFSHKLWFPRSLMYV